LITHVELFKVEFHKKLKQEQVEWNTMIHDVWNEYCLAIEWNSVVTTNNIVKFIKKNRKHGENLPYTLVKNVKFRRP
jgi:hypothetical protein